jgi:hypothetical protein
MNRLAQLVYYKGLVAKIEEACKRRYLKRIDYLAGANNDLMAQLEEYERIGQVEKV